MRYFGMKIKKYIVSAKILGYNIAWLKNLNINNEYTKTSIHK